MKIHIELPNEIHSQFKSHCALTGVSMTRIIGDLISEYLLRDSKEAKI